MQQPSRLLAGPATDAFARMKENRHTQADIDAYERWLMCCRLEGRDEKYRENRVIFLQKAKDALRDRH